jgi:hypothetical protein
MCSSRYFAFCPWLFSNSGRGVKLSVNILAGSIVLSAVGASPPHDGVRRRWWINVKRVLLFTYEHRKARGDRTNASVPAGTLVPAGESGNSVVLLCRLTSSLL